MIPTLVRKDVDDGMGGRTEKSCWEHCDDFGIILLH
jgi:hypothetical protein